MRSLTYLVAATIDGYIAGPDRADPTGTIFPVEGDHIEAIVTDYPEIISAHVRTMLGIDPPNVRFDTILEGRGSYQIGLDANITNAYPHLRHIVFSRSLPEQVDPSVEIVSTDPVAAVQQLKRDNGIGIWLCGGGQLAHILRSEIDELIVKLNPVVIGSGVPLFAGSFDLQRYTLTQSHTYRSGVVLLTYVKA